MSTVSSPTVVGIFRDRSMAEQAMNALYYAGFAHEDVYYSAPGAGGSFFEDIKSFFTGTNPSAGNLTSDLTTMGLSNEEAQYYSNEYNSGSVVLAVRAAGREQEALSILHQYGAYNTGASAASTDYSQQPINTVDWSTPAQSQTTNEQTAEDRHQQITPTAEGTADQPATSNAQGSTDYNTSDEPAQPYSSAPTYETDNQVVQESTGTPADDPNNQLAQPYTDVAESEAETPATSAESGNTNQTSQDNTTEQDVEAPASPANTTAAQNGTYGLTPQADETYTSTGTTSPNQASSVPLQYPDLLHSLQLQIQSTQQKLQEAKAQLQTAKEHESQIQNARQQLQELQDELQATQDELQKTYTRLGQHQ